MSVISPREQPLDLAQPRKGYRFSQDAVLLARFVRLPPSARVVDLGTGCGVVALMLARQAACRRVVGIEIQPELARLAERNARQNDLHRRFTLVNADMQRVNAQQVGGCFDVAVSNPPFRRVAAGRLNPDTGNAVARHELRITLSGLVETAGRLLRDSGRLFLVYTSERMVDLLAEMRRQAIEPKRLQMVHARAGLEARRVLVEGVKNSRRALTVMPPLVLDRTTPNR